MSSLANIFWLGTKELRSFLRDYVLLGLVVYAFSLAIIAQAGSSSQEVHNASVAIVDEDHSELSRRITQAFLPPYFQTPQPIAARNMVPLMNAGRYTFAIDIPPNFQRDVLAGRSPGLQINVDATAMVQAGSAPATRSRSSRRRSRTSCRAQPPHRRRQSTSSRGSRLTPMSKAAGSPA
jgi:ABC-2 type transport system permease protein